MILYLDTSALVKLYLGESGRDLVSAAMRRAALVTTTLITFVEARAAFAKATRMRSWSSQTEAWATARFIQDWAQLDCSQIDESLVIAAGELAHRYGLRGYDAVHLASALKVAASGSPVVFATFDVRLLNAAVAEGLMTDLTSLT